VPGKALNTPKRALSGAGLPCLFAHFFRPCTVLQATMQPGFQCSSVLQKKVKNEPFIAHILDKCFRIADAGIETWRPPLQET